jgi:hypothetical protein
MANNAIKLFNGTSIVTIANTDQVAAVGITQAQLDAALAGLDYQADILDLETNFVSGTSIAGRYIYVDGTKFTGGVAAGAAANDIVDVDASGAVTAVAYDVSVKEVKAQLFGTLRLTNSFAGMERIGQHSAVWLRCWKAWVLPLPAAIL